MGIAITPITSGHLLDRGLIQPLVTRSVTSNPWKIAGTRGIPRVVTASVKSFADWCKIILTGIRIPDPHVSHGNFRKIPTETSGSFSSAWSPQDDALIVSAFNLSSILMIVLGFSIFSVAEPWDEIEKSSPIYIA